MKLTSRYLNAKHWQLFLLFFGLPLLFEIVFFSTTLFTVIGNSENQEPTAILYSFRLFPIFMIVYLAVFLGWFWSISNGLQQIIPQNIKMNTKYLKFSIYYAFIYIVLICIFLFFQFTKFISIDNTDEHFSSSFTIVFGLIVPFHLFAMFSIFYSLYFTAKTIKTVELQRDVRLSEFIGEFFLLWFYPIGIWFIQPRVNRLIQLKQS